MKNLILLIFVSGIISCGGPSKKNIGEVPVEPYKISFDLENLSDKDAPMMSNIIDSLEYIKLEYNPDFQIGSILGRPYITKDYIYINCSHKVGLLQYKRDGKFVRKIGSFGRGPGEYLQLRDFIVNEKNGIIYTIPNWKAVLCKYDYYNGKFLEEIPILNLTEKGNSIYVNDIYSAYPLFENEIFVNPYGYGRSKEQKYNAFYTINFNSGNIIHREESKLYGLENLKINAKKSAVLASIPNLVWFDSHDRLNFWESLNDTIYVVNSDHSKTPRIITNFFSNRLDIQTALTVSDPNVYINKILLSSHLCESSRFLFFQFIFREKYISTTFDKITGNQYLLKVMSNEEFKTRGLFMGINNDIDGGFSNMWQYDKDMWYSSYSATEMIDKLTPEHFEEVRSKVKYPERLDKLKEFVTGLDEGDNPVFVIAHLKQKNVKK